MKLHLLLMSLSAVLLAIGPGHSRAANRCVAADGQVSFQDAPCPNASKAAAPLKLRENAISNSAGRPAGPETLAFGSDRYANVMIAAGAMEVLATNGRDCRIELKVRPGSDEAAKSCNRYLAQYRTWWSPAAKELGDAIKDDRWYQANREIIRKATDSAAVVNEVQSFITLSLRNR